MRCGGGVLTAKGESQWAWMQRKVSEEERDWREVGVFTFYLLLMNFFYLSLYLFFLLFFNFSLWCLCVSGCLVCLFGEREMLKQLN
jgi:hypothetical protein